VHRNRAIVDHDYEHFNIAVGRLERIAEQAYGR
jgi:hypothetical protein